MANINLNNPGIAMDMEAMVQATNRMDTAVENFVSLVTANLDSFTGLGSDVLRQLLQNILQESEQMSADFGVGTQTLEAMVELINGGDHQAAQILSGA